MTTTYTFQYGDHSVTLETGLIAKQTTSAVMVSMGSTVLLATLVAKPRDEIANFLPLTVNYQEKSYAAGSIPGGFLKREGRPTEQETLISRLIDRAIRPLFDKAFRDEVQIVVTLLSFDEKVSPDIPAVLAVSAAIGLAKLPVQELVAIARVGYENEEFTLNAAANCHSLQQLNLLAAATSESMIMIESAAQELDESTMLHAMQFAHEQIKPIIQHINTFINQAKTTGYLWEPAVVLSETLKQEVSDQVTPQLQAIYEENRFDMLEVELVSLKEQITSTSMEIAVNSALKVFVESWVDQLHKQIARRHILQRNKRLDGRYFDEIRPLSIRVGLLPKAHGSALFTRGQTQALAVATLGSEKDAQRIEKLGCMSTDRFMLHYNFPPYCVGETGFMMGPKRREIGHGHLAKRALQPVLPSAAEFPYTLRLVSEITEANGSSSMATVCGGSLALMDAGVPIHAPVAGIAMGLMVVDHDKHRIFSDISETEDHFGDMDFKVAGTEQGITALQMDVKTHGITASILGPALEQARQGRLFLLSTMKTVLPEARASLSPHAPCTIRFQIPTDQIREVIGKGGATIRSLCEETECEINIDDEGILSITAKNQISAQQAKQRIEMLIKKIAIGDFYEGRIVKKTDYGCFVNLKPGKDGLLHVSEMTETLFETMNESPPEGELITVRVLNIDRYGKISLTMKEEESIET